MAPPTLLDTRKHRFTGGATPNAGKRWWRCLSRTNLRFLNPHTLLDDPVAGLDTPLFSPLRVSVWGDRAKHHPLRSTTRPVWGISSPATRAQSPGPHRTGMVVFHLGVESCAHRSAGGYPAPPAAIGSGHQGYLRGVGFVQGGVSPASCHGAWVFGLPLLGSLAPLPRGYTPAGLRSETGCDRVR